MSKNNRKQWVIQRLKDIVGEIPGEFVAEEVLKEFNRGAGIASLSPREVSGFLRYHKIARMVPDRRRGRRRVWVKV